MRKRPTLRVAAFVRRNQEVLLVRQERGSRTHWLPPGGGVELGESASDALVRELQEECGLRARPLLPPLGMVESISPDGGLSRHVVHLLYAVDIDDPGECRPADATIKEARGFAGEELARLAIHPPIADLLFIWLEHFGAEDPGPWPTFLSAGVRWTD
jgi:ADP-ribose pyrophosphatase YjhB (NUDIX family)